MFRSIANSRTLWLACAVVLSGGLGLLSANQRKTPAAQPSMVSPIRTTPAEASVPRAAPGQPGSRDREAGACCIGEVCTEMTDPLECLDMGGTFIEGVGCDPNPCVPQVSGCCLFDGVTGFDCVDVEGEAECAAMGGVLLSDPCPTEGQASACLYDPECYETIYESCCTAYEGTYVPGSSCAVGACCLSDGCIETYEAACEITGGYFFYGIECDDAPCAYKMHYPQRPDDAGWDVNATYPVVLADDWMCSETGWVKDIHFWGSWRNGIEGQIQSFILSIHDDIPANPPDEPYSRPGALLWELETDDFESIPLDASSMQGWYDPYTGEVLPDNHTSYQQYNIYLPENHWFSQEADTIYWLNISAVLEEPADAVWGWSSSQNHWNDDAVWALSDTFNWIDLWEPSESVTDIFSVEFDPYGTLINGSGSGFNGGEWYYYPNTGWWNQWFYDHPFDPQRHKTIQIEIDVTAWDPDLSGTLELAVNWSTPEWSLTGNPPGDPRVPPLPPLTDVEEGLYIGREILLDVDVTSFDEHYTLEFEIPDYNPEWVSIDVRGENFVILPDGLLTHECKGSLDLAYVITGGETDECCVVHLDEIKCLKVEPGWCYWHGGIPLGQDCMDTGPIGYCCLPDGLCDDQMIDSLCCELLGGEFTTPGTCGPDGACCSALATCQETTENCCDVVAGGAFIAGDDCSGDIGACCFEIGTCSDNTTANCCEELGGWHIAGGTCSSESGACCINDGTCKDGFTPECCTAIGGNYQGAGSICEQPLGGCCHGADFSCTRDTTETCCEDVGGFFHPGQNCSGTITRGCCFGDGSCNFLDELCCTDFGGFLASGHCIPTGACCYPGGGCVDTVADCCTGTGGTFVGVGKACAQDVCCAQDSDCAPDGNECTGEHCNVATGVCTYPPRPAGTPCGDQSDTECDNPNTCDGGGGCQDNNEPNGTPCTDDGNVCTYDYCTGGACTHPPNPDYSELIDSGEFEIDLDELNDIASWIEQAPGVSQVEFNIGGGGSYTDEEVCCPPTGPTTIKHTVEGSVSVNISVHFNIPGFEGGFDISLPFGIGSAGLTWAFGPYVTASTEGTNFTLTGTYIEPPCESGCIAVAFTLQLNVTIGVEAYIRAWTEIWFLGEFVAEAHIDAHGSGGVGISGGYVVYGSGCEPDSGVHIDPITFTASANLTVSWNDHVLGDFDTGEFEVTLFEGADL
jgi:hypothetical protein